MEKLIRENREKLAEADVKAVEAAIEKGKSALSGGTLETIQAAATELESASHKLAEVLYRASAAAGAAGGPGTGTPGGAAGGPQAEGPASKKPGEGEVIDAEYVDVDESKKPN